MSPKLIFLQDDTPEFKAVILLIIRILIQQLHLELFGGKGLWSLDFKYCLMLIYWLMLVNPSAIASNSGPVVGKSN